MSLHVSALGASLDRKNVLCTEASVLWKIKFCIGDLHIGFPWVPCQRELDPECVFCVASNFADASFDSWHFCLSHQSAIILWLNLGIMIGMWFCFLTCSEKSDLASRPVFSQFNICHLWKHSRTSPVSLFIPQSVKKKSSLENKLCLPFPSWLRPLQRAFRHFPSALKKSPALALASEAQLIERLPVHGKVTSSIP